MRPITEFTIEQFYEIHHKLRALELARKEVSKHTLIGRAAIKMKPDLMQKYEHCKSEYDSMLPLIEARAVEIVNDFKMVGEKCTLNEIEVHRNMEGKTYIIAIFDQNNGDAALETVELKAEWFTSDDYKEKAAVEQAKHEAREYEEYLRLKAKFEKKE